MTAVSGHTSQTHLLGPITERAAATVILLFIALQVSGVTVVCLTNGRRYQKPRWQERSKWTRGNCNQIFRNDRKKDILTTTAQRQVSSKYQVWRRQFHEANKNNKKTKKQPQTINMGAATQLATEQKWAVLAPCLAQRESWIWLNS